MHHIDLTTSHPRRGSRRAVPVGAALAAGATGILALACVVGPSASAAATSKQSAPAAFVRVAHLSPDTGGVDVYLTAFNGGRQKLWVSGVGYGDFSGYRRVPSGTYAVSMRPHDAPASTQPALSWTLRLGSGRAYTAAAIGLHASLHGVILGDSATAPKANSGLLRVIQASNRAGTVDVSAGSTPIGSATPFGTTTPYRDVAAGTTTLLARSTSDSTLTAQEQLPVRSGTITTVVVLDKKGGGLTLRTLTDAAGAGASPQGAVPAGGGGTADRFVGHGSGQAWWAAGTLSLALGLGGVAVRRRAARSS